MLNRGLIKILHDISLVPGVYNYLLINKLYVGLIVAMLLVPMITTLGKSMSTLCVSAS